MNWVLYIYEYTDHLVTVAPAFKWAQEFPGDIRMRVGESRTIRVPFDACPPPEISWSCVQRGSSSRVPLTETGRRVRVESASQASGSGSSTQLVFNRVEVSESGTYRVCLQNAHGSVEHEFSLSVIGAHLVNGQLYCAMNYYY